ncbi:MAG: DUF3536 domain-containing protein [Candidatus Gastranaerophilales bacterium]|nr:DUF3536 domain-containing protein [Candidatus Gastranaerophilales bacterium]
MSENKKYLTIHGHFYQPPRENPWIEEIEIQDSAAPNHDWNEKICWQCYSPNSVSRIVDGTNSIIEISNNYKYMSFNFGPTLLSWMEKYNKPAYDRIIQADIESRELYDGHGCAIAQVYNHIIMPLANQNDKITQVIWGLKDFQKRFGRNSEGIWLAETAVDAQTLEVLIDCGVKYTILSPHQAKCINKIGEHNWQDVSWGSIDPSRAYRYFVEGTDKEKYIDLFFYDGSISKSVAFDNLLCDGKKFSYRLNDGFVQSRNHAQIVNIATDGESYGHHTKFGDMALAYVLKVGAKELGFEITNYAQFLEKHPPQYEVDIKPVSAWSCAHGVGRWMDDCGCSTGAQPHWNQKWRKPLRQALDYLRDELINLCSIQGTKYYKDFWEARNNYIDVILDRTKETIDEFFKQNAKKNLSEQDKIKAIKLMEIQRFSQLMFTSCGWFFADISGIETTQIMKYAARAMELASEFSKTNYEKTFLSILQKAKSNIMEFGNGKDIFNRWVKPSAVGFEKITAQYAIESSFDINDDKKETDLYCFKVKRNNVKKYASFDNILSFGKIDVTSKITFEKKEMSYVILQTQNYDFYCAVKQYKCAEDYNLEAKEISKIFKKESIVETLQAIELYYGSKFYSLKDIPIDRRKNTLENMIQTKLQKAAQTYADMYDGLLNPISHLNDLGMDIPEGFRVCAKYTLLSNLEEELLEIKKYDDKASLERLVGIKQLADKFKIKLNTPKIRTILSASLARLMGALEESLTIKNAKELINYFELLEKLNIETEISTAQNTFYAMFCKNFEQFFDKTKAKFGSNTREIMLCLLEIGKKLNINVNFYRDKIDSLTGKIN